MLEIRCWSRMEKISCTGRVRNEEVLYTVWEKRKEGKKGRSEVKTRMKM
jgi:hypothetical protein